MIEGWSRSKLGLIQARGNVEDSKPLRVRAPEFASDCGDHVEA